MNKKSAELTDRQLQIARLVAQGLTSGQIAEQLSIVLRTVETHLSAIFRKLKVGSREELIATLAADSKRR